jgi:hypothetical protein
MQVRKRFQNEVSTALDNTRFTASDFLIEFPDKGDTHVRITFKHHPEFNIRLYKVGNTFQVDECPSDYYFVGTLVAAPKDFPKNLTAWTNYIYDELRAMTPMIYDDFEELRRELEQRLKDHVVDNHSHFSVEEAETIRKKLAEFDKLLAMHAETHVELKKEIESLRAQLAGANQTVDSYSKPIWFSTTFNKLANGMKSLAKSNEFRQVAMETMKGLLFREIDGGGNNR